MPAVTFLVRLDLPSGADEVDARDYVQEAVSASCGGLDPRDPMFRLVRSSVAVSITNTNTKRI